MSLNETFDGDGNVSAVSVNLSLLTSTPFKLPFKKPRGGKKKTFVKPVCDVCNICGQEYRCHRSYVNHMRKHTIKDATSRYPSPSLIIQHCHDTFGQSLDLMRTLPACGETGTQFLEMVDMLRLTLDHPNEFLEIVHEGITSDIGEVKVLLPSTLVAVLLKNCEDILANQDLRIKLCELLQACVSVRSDVCHAFVADYVLSLVTKIVKFYSSCIKNEVVNAPESTVPAVLDFEDLETIHYICGSIVRGFYKKSEQFPKNVGWNSIRQLILHKLLESDTVPGPPESVKGWTKSRNRGRLFFVSGALFDFFTGVAQILQSTTFKKSRVDPSIVLESVSKGPVIILWDEAVGSDYLTEKASYDLMYGMVKSFCNTYGGGHMKKLLNEIRRNKAEASLALRAKVAPRK